VRVDPHRRGGHESQLAVCYLIREGVWGGVRAVLEDIQIT